MKLLYAILAAAIGVAAVVFGGTTTRPASRGWAFSSSSARSYSA
jgi:hypothetical protein